MSDRARSAPRGIASLAAALIALSAFTADMHAQEARRESRRAPVAPTAEPTAAAQLDRVTRLARQHELAATLAELALGRQSDVSGLATVTAGSLVVLVDPRNRAAAARATAEAWTDIERAFGDASHGLASRPIVVRYGMVGQSATAAGGASGDVGERGDGEPRGESGDADDGDDTAEADGVANRGNAGYAGKRDPSARSAVSVAAVRRDITRRAATAMREQLDPRLQRWLGTYDPGALEQRALVRLYEELATAPSRLASDCIGGALDACADALVLRELDRPLYHWYDARHRRAIAERWRYRLRPSDPSRYDRCTAGDDAACDAVLATLAREQVIAPLSHQARHALVAIAIEIGGPEAFGHLASSTGRSVEDRLALAAGVPRDSLVAAWRARVLAAQPRAARLQPRLAIPSILTVLCFGFLATRSSRWR
ncbi:MAG TPA: hypothetical protein VMM18_05200 [Gemmatimonadaceae bacterium]|nr:hypothetical protein [Gemmatimonadaceae bacterium]